ncbi:hypothetical protein ACFWAP_20595 [Streptomyces goshikiensis]|uniref:hypothetical protein n=1 Tax=Streptomyces goshikiensis TaxID=1942 RepID=UPI003647FFD8
MNHRSVRVIGMTVAALAGLAGCGGGKPLDGSAPEPRPSAVPAHVAAYRAGYTAGKGETRQDGHVRVLTVVQLTERDYDVELSTDYPAGPPGKPGAESLARSFAEWWDGDHGRDGTARNVLVLGADGKRLTAQRI